jgi:large subunit ribosomal protein L2
MAIIKRRPLTPTQRFTELSRNEVDNKRPERSLTESKHRAKGRNCYGRITSRRRGGGHKKLYRIVDFKRDIVDIPATVMAIEYDPYRTAYIALVQYQDADNTKRYIIAPDGLKKGDTVITLTKRPSEFPVGTCLPLKFIPPAQKIFCLEMQPGKGGQIVRSAGMEARLMAKEGKYATIKLPSGEMRLVLANCKATIGQVGNLEHEIVSIGKAGRTRHMGIRPTVRGSVMNPCDHPHGGGEGKSPVGRKSPLTPWGKPALGKKTRNTKKQSSKLIIKRAN